MVMVSEIYHYRYPNGICYRHTDKFNFLLYRILAGKSLVEKFEKLYYVIMVHNNYLVNSCIASDEDNTCF